MYLPLNEQETKQFADEEEMMMNARKKPRTAPTHDNGAGEDFRIMEHFVRAFIEEQNGHKSGKLP